MSGHPLRHTAGNKAKNIHPLPVLPTAEQVAILRRAAAGYIFVTQTGTGPKYRYDDGSPVTLKPTKIGPALWDDGERQFNRMVKEGWLIPDLGDSLFPDGPAQIYRARRPWPSLPIAPRKPGELTVKPSIAELLSRGERGL